MITYRKVPLYNVRQISDKCLAASIPGQAVDILLPIGLTIYRHPDYWVPQWILERNKPMMCIEEYDVELFEPDEILTYRVGCVA